MNIFLKSNTYIGRYPNLLT